jgi:hypothetical protein
LLPSLSCPVQNDGTGYHWIGEATNPLYRCLEYQYDEPPPCPLSQDGSHTCAQGTFDCLTGCSDPLQWSLLFEQSQSQYVPGYQAHSIESDPQFRTIGADGVFRVTDDLRLLSTSQARAAGVTLPEDLLALDAAVVPPTGGEPDIGCYPYGSGPLRVGVDRRRSSPTSP